MSRPRFVFVVTAVVGIVVLVSLMYGTFIPRIPLPFVSVPSASTTIPDQVLVPASPPAGLAPYEMNETNGGAFDRLSVYAEPGRADVFTGRVLGVLYMRADELTELPRGVGFRPVRVNLHDGRVGRVGDQVWVVWDVWFDGNQEVDEIGVIGFGLTEDEVIGAARHVYKVSDDGGAASARLGWGGVPSGLAPITAGAVRLDGLGGSGVLANHTVMIWGRQPDGPYLTIEVSRGDAGATVLARFATLGVPRSIRGAPGSVGITPGWGPYQRQGTATAYTWAENDLVVHVTARGIPAGEVDAILAGLRLLPAREATALFPAHLTRPWVRIRPGNAGWWPPRLSTGEPTRSTHPVMGPRRRQHAMPCARSCVTDSPYPSRGKTRMENPTRCVQSPRWTFSPDWSRRMSAPSRSASLRSTASRT